MDAHWGAQRSIEILSGFGRWLSGIPSTGFRNVHLVRDFEALALIAQASDLAELAASILHSLPDRAFTEGIITNAGDLSRLIQRSPAALAAAESRFPVYTDEIQRFVASQKEPHIALAFAGELSMAFDRASTPLDREEFASTCAMAGRFDEALETLDREDVEDHHKPGPRIVVCVESFRAGRLDLAERLIAEHFSTPGHWSALKVVAGLLDRVPWAGYPYPDY